MKQSAYLTFSRSANTPAFWVDCNKAITYIIKPKSESGIDFGAKEYLILGTNRSALPRSATVLHPNVYADLSTITWIIPRETFHAYLRGLIQNGLSKRLMFGSDQMMWPETIALAIEAIESANFLTEEQKRDIFYNNAARFLRLSEEEIASHHGK